MTVPRVTETTPAPTPVEPDTFGGAVSSVDAAFGWPVPPQRPQLGKS